MLPTTVVVVVVVELFVELFAELCAELCAEVSVELFVELIVRFFDDFDAFLLDFAGTGTMGICTTGGACETWGCGGGAVCSN